METNVIKLYSAEELGRVGRGLVLLRALAVLLGLITLGVCIVFCAEADRHSPAPALIRTIIASVIGGWAVITLRVFFILPLRYRREHIKAMLEGREETVSGPFTLTKDRTIIRKGVSMLRVDCPGGQLQIYDRKARAFDAGSAKAVRTVYGFIVGYEV